MTKRWHRVAVYVGGVVILLGFCVIIASGNMTTPLAVGVLTALAVVLAAMVTHVSTKRREIEARHFEQKRLMYEELLGAYTELLRQNISALGKPKRSLSPQEIAVKLFDLKRKILLWGDRRMLAW